MEGVLVSSHDLAVMLHVGPMQRLHSDLERGFEKSNVDCLDAESVLSDTHQLCETCYQPVVFTFNSSLIEPIRSGCIYIFLSGCTVPSILNLSSPQIFIEMHGDLTTADINYECLCDVCVCVSYVVYSVK